MRISDAASVLSSWGNSLLRLILLLTALFIASNAVAADDRQTCEAQGDKAIAACTRVISSRNLAPTDQASIYFLRGTAYRRKGDFDRAAADLSQAIQLTEKNGSREVTASIYVVRAGVYSQKSDFEKALADYRTALTFDSKNEQATGGVTRTEAALATARLPSEPITAPPATRDSIHGWSAGLRIEFSATGGQSWCGTDVSILLTAERGDSFQPDSVAFQRMIGRIRAAVQAECPTVQTVLFDGKVNNELVYAGETSSLGEWRHVVLDPSTRKSKNGNE